MRSIVVFSSVLLIACSGGDKGSTIGPEPVHHSVDSAVPTMTTSPDAAPTPRPNATEQDAGGQPKPEPAGPKVTKGTAEVECALAYKATERAGDQVEEIEQYAAIAEVPGLDPNSVIFARTEWVNTQPGCQNLGAGCQLTVEVDKRGEQGRYRLADVNPGTLSVQCNEGDPPTIFHYAFLTE
jgi:hypothetical protein